MEGSDRSVITVDGPAASGKSTVARRLAESLGFRYVNSGAFYRAFALAISRQPGVLDEESALAGFLGKGQVEIGPEERTFLNGEDVTEEIRTKETSRWASRVAALARVRGRVNEELHRIAASSNCVIDGRDIGSVVFPNADLKIYLEASLEARSQRRLLDYQRAGREAVLEEIMQELAERDGADASRDLAPMKAPEGALTINSTDRSVDEIVADLLVRAREALEKGASDNPSPNLSASA